MKLLVVEDDTLFGQMLAAILSNLNYAVDVATDGEEAWDLIQCYSYDLILLDVLLPSLDGISLCRRIRSSGKQMPILLVTGCNDSHEKAVGLNAGADDYVVKPFDQEELVARVHALLRRGAVSSQPVLEYGDLRLYPVNCEVTYCNEILTLTPKEYALLELFMRNSKRLFSCGMILEQLWSYEDVPSEEAVRTHIKGLRQKLKAAGAEADLIETVYGIGYRLKAIQKSKSTPNLKTKQKTLLGVAEIWQKYKGRVSEQVNILAQAALCLINKNLDTELRSVALKEAHTLAGSLASFGFPEGSKIAAQLEKLLKVKSLDIDNVNKFGTLVKALQQAIEPSGRHTSVIEEVVDSRTLARILVVDDDPKILAILETLLAPWGLQVFPLDNPQHFQETLQAVNPDLVILDVEMPQISGIELCQQVRNDSDWGDLPILFLTVHNDAPIINQVFTVGADDFVSKPIIGPELVTRILNRLERGKLRRKHAQADVRQINRMLKTLSACNKSLLRADNELDLLHNICKILTEVGKYKSVWVGFVDSEAPLEVIPVALQGVTETDNLLDIGIQAITTVQTYVYEAGNTNSTNSTAISIPLIWNRKAFGVINISANESNAFDAEAVKQLEQLTADLAYSIISLRREQERTNELVKVNQTLQCELERRLQMQEALRNSQALFAGIVSIADDAIISIDSDQCITLFNSGAERIFGYLTSEVLGKPLDLLLPQRYTKVHRRHVSEFETSPNQSRKMGERREIYGKRKDGTEFPAEASISKLKLGDETVYTVYLQDVSDRKQIERMKNEFISVVSHELRTPLTSIHGSLGMLASGLLKPDSEQSKRLLQIATDSTERLVRLINDVLDIERIESGRVKMSKQTCNAADLINEAVNVIQPLADKLGIVLSVTKLSINVWVDSDRIVQTLTNLLGNAIKFSKSDTTVWLEVKQQDKQVLFIVKDNGRGIPEDKLEIIFERFQQLDASDARRQDGTGLGLAICKSIIQQHNGNIWAESTLGEGSTFYFTIPLEC